MEHLLPVAYAIIFHNRLYFFKLASGPGLTNYVSRRLSEYGNSISNICMIR